MLKCGITGSTGNLGKSFIKNNKKFKFIKFKGDITKKNDVNIWIKKYKFDLIIHFAALVPVSKVNKDYKKALKINYLGTQNIVNAIIENNIEIDWFFFSSTSHVYPFKFNPIKETNILNPISKYGKTKLMAEKFIVKKLEKTKINYCIGRIFSIFDNNGKEFFMKSLIRRIKTKQNLIKLDNMNHFRDFLTTKQISEIIIKLSKKKYRGIINIGSGKKTDLKKIAIILAKKFRKKIIFQKNKPTCSVSSNFKLKELGIKFKALNISKELNLII